jgi:hypothetical protein
MDGGTLVTVLLVLQEQGYRFRPHQFGTWCIVVQKLSLSPEREILDTKLHGASGGAWTWHRVFANAKEKVESHAGEIRNGLYRKENDAAPLERQPFGWSGWVEPVGVWGRGCHLCSSLEDGEMANLVLWNPRFFWGHQTQPTGGFAPRDARPFPQTGGQLARLFRKGQYEPKWQRQ